MISKTKIKRLQTELLVFINTYPGGDSESLEFVNSTRVLYLLQSKRELVQSFTVIDVNNEISKAINAANSISHSVRDTFVRDFNLVKNAPFNQVQLPQVYLRDGSKRHYLGGYEVLQYLEDCSLLDKVVTQEICSHYRIYKGFPHYRYSWHKNQLECIDCSFKERKPPITVVTNYLNSQDQQSHDLCLFFERNHLPFSLVDSQSQEESRVFINGIEIAMEKLVEFCQKGILKSLIDKARCLRCLNKIKGTALSEVGGICQKCKSLTSIEEQKVTPGGREAKVSEEEKQSRTKSESITPKESKTSKLSKQSQAFRFQSQAKVSAQMQLRQSLKVEDLKKLKSDIEKMNFQLPGNKQ